jgi:hypothetical protein
LDDVDKKEVGKEDTEKDVNVQNQAISRKKSTHWLISLGPGVITGASDDDPSGIATYSQAGACVCGKSYLDTIAFDIRSCTN